MSEFSFGARVDKGKKLRAAVVSFGNFVPGSGNKSAAGLADAIHGLELRNPPLNNALYAYRDSVFERRRVFVSREDSITLVLSPILSYVSGEFGKKSNQYRVIKSLVGKLRGQRLGAVNPDPTAATHSVSQMSYGDMYQNFNTLVTMIVAFGIEYDPSNPVITVVSLQAIRDEASEKNDLVNVAFDALSPLQESRSIAYDEFSVQCQCVKNLVKSQYGVGSNQYKMVKGLDI